MTATIGTLTGSSEAGCAVIIGCKMLGCIWTLSSGWWKPKALAENKFDNRMLNNVEKFDPP